MAKRSMASIASGEPLPIIPPSDDPETEKWRRDILNWMRRLTGLFTDDNLPSGGGAASGDVDGLHAAFATDDFLHANGRQVLIEAAPFAFTLNTITHRASANSITFELFSAGSLRTGTGDDSFGTTQGVFTPTNGAVAVGELVELDLIGNLPVPPFNIAVSLKRTRT